VVNGGIGVEPEGERPIRSALVNRGSAGRLDQLMCSSPLGRVAKWQTRWLQVPVGEIPWGFKSPLAHSRTCVRLAVKMTIELDAAEADYLERGV
jgi:hypothetical protein